MDINKEYEIYFFDFFGTIMHRKCSGDDIKKIWSNQLALLCKCKLSSRIWYELRISAEKYVCRKENHYEFTYKELIKEIYNRVSGIAEGYADILDFEQFYMLCLKIELDVETNMQEKNEEVISQIKQLKGCGKKVCILSDFYLDSQCISRFLEKKGENHLVDNIFVSCEFLKNKADGSLYKEILTLLNCSSKDCCMIGDNYRSDFINAKSNGISAVRVRDNKKFNRDINCKKVLTQLMNTEHKNGISYANYSFMLFKFISALYNKLLLHSDRKVFFLAREGELLKQLFDRYCEYMQVQFGSPCIKSEYLYVSRQATYPASLKCLEEEQFETLFKEYSALSIESFLTNIGIGSPIDLLDWASRIVFVWQGMQWIEKSFSKSKKQKPFIRDLRNYIQQRKEWNLVELEKNLHAHQELLRIVLEEQGYVCRDGMIYRYDKTIAEKLEQERNAFLEKRYDNHGTNVNCFEMNVAVEQLNVDLLYFAVLEKECNKLEEYDEKVKELLAPLKECGPYIIWDDLDRSIQIAKNIPKSFCEKDLELIWQCVKEVDERVLVEANKLENER